MSVNDTTDTASTHANRIDQTRGKCSKTALGRSILFGYVQY